MAVWNPTSKLTNLLLSWRPPAHRAAVVIADAVDEIAGWSAGFEVAGPGYRADVMATGPLGRRIAFEVQRSTIAAAVAVARTRRHRADGVALTVWIDLPYAVRASLRAVPTVSTLRRQPGMTRAAGVPLTPLSAFAASVCTGSLSWSPYDAPRTGGHWLSERDRLANSTSPNTGPRSSLAFYVATTTRLMARRLARA
jgi:hypothetical protein